MTLMPGVEHDLLPENATQPALNPTQVILHTAVDFNLDIPDYFRRRDVHVESHFWITRDGRITQMMDTNVVAHANYGANRSAISIETEDDGDPEANPWTPAQIDSLIRVIRWAAAEHDIPLRRCRHPTDPGVGWHSMWGYADPINLTGPQTNPWSPAFGKTCPGRTRIRQIVDTIEPALYGGTPVTEPSEGLKQIQQMLLDNDPNALPKYGVDGRADRDGETVKAVAALIERNKNQAEGTKLLQAEIAALEDTSADLKRQLLAAAKTTHMGTAFRDAVAAAVDELGLR